MNMLRVKAAQGRALPWPGRPGDIVGMREAAPDAPEDSIVHRVDGGRRYVDAGVVEVPDDLYFRRALNRGDLVRADSADATAPSRTAPRGRG